MSLIYSANMKHEYYVGKKIAVHQVPGGLEGIIYEKTGAIYWEYDYANDCTIFFLSR